MSERGLDVLDKYDFEVLKISKVRGALLCETEKGSFLLKEFKGHEARLEIEDRILNLLSENICVETYRKNLEGALVTESEEGIKYVVKTWHEGSECNIRDLKEICLAVRMLAWLHLELEKLSYIAPVCEYKGEDDVTVSYSFVPKEPAGELFLRHNRELSRVRTYIKGRKNKNSFERLVMTSFDTFFSQACHTAELMKGGQPQIAQQWCHGEFCHHNVILGQRQNYIIEFSHMNKGIQIEDLYYFMRKVLEKNRWDFKLGKAMTDAYSSVRAISAEEWNYIYLLFLYPEKYWKQLNFYYASNKAWIPEKNVEKLMAVVNQQPAREAFLSELKKRTSFA